MEKISCTSDYAHGDQYHSRKVTGKSEITSYFAISPPFFDTETG